MLMLTLAHPVSVVAAPLELVGLSAMDTPNDSGHSVMLSWPARAGESKDTLYQVEAAVKAEGPWIRVLRFDAVKQWQSDYPESYGRLSREASAHAIKIDTAPPPEKVVEKLRATALADLEVTRKRFDAAQTDLDAASGDLAAYLKGREDLESRIQAIANQDSLAVSRRVALIHELDRFKRDHHRLTSLSDRLEALDSKRLRLESWKPPELIRLEPDYPYHFRVSAMEDGLTVASSTVSVSSVGNWFNAKRSNNLVITLLLATLILYYTNRARKNPEQIFVRRIAGLEAVDEAIGRATEMGKPIFFVHGLAAISTISTVAAINILGKIAEKVAEYGTEFKVTNRDPVVLAVSQETVKESYLRAGRPDLYNEDNVFYVSQDQFSYATGVEGMFLREKPASNFYFGYYYAEALLLTETGAHIGAIQIAGTDSYTQLPFFITTCDYTLMGEELYAASAYMSREPKLLASLKAQDITKGILILFALAGVVLSTFGINWLLHWTQAL